MKTEYSERFTYVGRVTPDKAPLTVKYKPKYHLQPTNDFQPACLIEVEIRDGRCEVQVNVETYSFSSAIRLFQSAWDGAQRLADTIGFIRAIPYTVTIDELVEPDGKVRPLTLGDTLLRNLHSFTEDDAERFFDLLIQDFSLGQALSDLVSMLGRSHYAPISYGRVVDSIARLVAPNLQKNAMWAETRRQLHVDQAFLQRLTDISKGPRHGDRTPISAEENRELSKMAWILMERYLHYRFSGESLPIERYPELKG